MFFSVLCKIKVLVCSVGMVCPGHVHHSFCRSLGLELAGKQGWGWDLARGALAAPSLELSKARLDGLRLWSSGGCCSPWQG